MSKFGILDNDDSICQQYFSTRKERGKKQKLYLIDSLKVTRKYKRQYAVMGSTGNLYTVAVCKIPECTCPDYQTRHRRCKHIYFILIRILHVKPQNEDKDMFTNNELTKMFNSIPKIITKLVVDDSIKNKYNDVKKNIVNKPNKKSTDDLCPICLDDLDNGDDLDYCKYSCGKQIHIDCFQMWIKVKPKKCLFCTKSWDFKEINNTYINLMS
jgi:hypothetical protein